MPFKLLSNFVSDGRVQVARLNRSKFQFQLTRRYPRPRRFLVYFCSVGGTKCEEIRVQEFKVDTTRRRYLRSRRPIRGGARGCFCERCSIEIRRGSCMRRIQQLTKRCGQCVHLGLRKSSKRLTGSLANCPTRLSRVRYEDLRRRGGQ